MDRAPDPFIALAQLSGERTDEPPRPTPPPSPLRAALPTNAPVIGRLQGFDLLEQPLVGDVPLCPGQVLAARTTVHLRRDMIGHEVVVWFDGSDARVPIIMGVLAPQGSSGAAVPANAGVTVQVDGERHLIQAEREIVLRCGDASITLTRAGKVIIQGHYILSRSTGYNKIKGAAIDIN